LKRGLSCGTSTYIC